MAQVAEQARKSIELLTRFARGSHVVRRLSPVRGPVTSAPTQGLEDLCVCHQESPSPVSAHALSDRQTEIHVAPRPATLPWSRTLKEVGLDRLLPMAPVPEAWRA